MDKITIEGATIVYDSAWPKIDVKSMDEALQVGADQHAYDTGELSAADFQEMWGIHPDDDYIVSYEVKETD